MVRLRQVRVASVARTEQVCFGPGAIRSPDAQTSLGIDRLRDPSPPTIAIKLASPARCQVPSRPRHRSWAFPSLCWVRAEGRGARNPARSIRLGRDHPDRWGNAGRSTAPAPQSKPGTRASRLVAQTAPLVALRFRLRILATGPAPVRLYSYFKRRPEEGCPRGAAPPHDHTNTANRDRRRSFSIRPPIPGPADVAAPRDRAQPGPLVPTPVFRPKLLAGPSSR
jgi:hypothetical protein